MGAVYSIFSHLFSNHSGYGTLFQSAGSIFDKRLYIYLQKNLVCCNKMLQYCVYVIMRIYVYTYTSYTILLTSCWDPNIISPTKTPRFDTQELCRSPPSLPTQWPWREPEPRIFPSNSGRVPQAGTPQIQIWKDFQK